MSMLRLLADEVDEDVYANLISAGTRPLIMVHVPQMAKQVTAMKLEQEREERVENLKNTPIEEIIKEQKCTGTGRTLGEVKHHDTDAVSSCHGVLLRVC